MLIFKSLAVTAEFSTERINSTAVIVMWTEVHSDFLDHYTVYYNSDPDQNDRRKRQNNEQSAIFLAGSSSGVIGGLDEEHNYLFSLAVTFKINGLLFEGERTEPVSIGWMPCILIFVLSLTNGHNQYLAFLDR